MRDAGEGPCLKQHFDAVVMLTWSDWHTEPRSNRYHYATRFARHLPVLFVQPDLGERGWRLERIDGSNITILHVGDVYSQSGADFFKELIASLGYRRPLLWVYNTNFARLVSKVPRWMKIYHATENYFEDESGIGFSSDEIQGDLRTILAHTDLLVGVSQGVIDDFVQKGGFCGATLLLENGCDFEFWSQHRSHESETEQGGKPVAFFQGGINRRLDLALLEGVIRQMPDWDFRFAGKLDPGFSKKWSQFLKITKARYIGAVDTAELARQMRQSTVGLIPFIDDPLMRKSLPLKAYEYVSAGLPVVSTPIDALAARPDMFTIAMTAEEMAAAMRRLAPTRVDQEKIALRRAAARQESYDGRFANLVDRIGALKSNTEVGRDPLNVLMIYDDRSAHVMTIKEHLSAFRRHSRHNFFYLPGTIHYGVPTADQLPAAWDLSYFDAVIVHYSVRLNLTDYFLRSIANAMAAYDGQKLLFIQDEYEDTEIARKWMELVRFDTVFTCVPPEGVEYVYPKSRFPDTAFIQTLTGYVPEDEAIEAFATPLAERKLRIAYRGRDLPHHYGTLGHEKYQIGLDVRRLADERGIPVDIEVTGDKRIYGNDWYRFMGSARATLGTESGANIFDFDGSLKQLAEQLKNERFADVYDAYFRQHESPVPMNQISPKIFEAIRLRTALVLFEGSYSNVVEAGRHYIPLKKDYSNIDEVFSKLEDLDSLTELTERAYDEIIRSERHSYRAFVEEIDGHINRTVGGWACAEFIMAPVARRRRGRDAFELVPYAATHELALNSHIMGGVMQRDVLAQPPMLGASLPGAALAVEEAGAAAARQASVVSSPAAAAGSGLAGKGMSLAARLVPRGVKSRVVGLLRGHYERARHGKMPPASLRAVWRMLPLSVKQRLKSRLTRVE